MSFRREPFLPCKIGQLLNSKISMISDSPMIIDTNTNNPISFVKLYGTIIDTVSELNESNPDFSWIYIKLDDGTGSLWLKSNDTTYSKINKWEFVQVIGSLIIEKNDSNLELTVNPDSIVVMEDKTWELVHNLEVKLKSQKPNVKTPAPVPQEYQRDESSSFHATQSDSASLDQAQPIQDLDTLSGKIENILRTSDSGDGVSFAEIVKMLPGSGESEIDDVLFELAYEGKVYQPKPDYYKIMD